MDLTILAFLNGFSELCLVLLGVYYCIRFIIYYAKHRKNLEPPIALLALTLGLMHLGGATAFIMKLFWGLDLDITVYGFLSYIHTPFGWTLAVYLGYEIFNPKLKWWMVSIYATIGIGYMIAMISWPSLMITGTTPVMNEVVDVNLSHVALAITIIYLVSAVLVLGTNFLVIRGKMNEKESVMKKKALLIGIGWILFSLAGLLCTVNPYNITIVPNTMSVVAFMLIFTGFKPIKEGPKGLEMK